MSFSDRLRSWLKGETKRAAPSRSSDKPSRGSIKEMEEFITSRVGVEAYLEPKTAIYSTTILLVADDGEYLRRPVRDLSEARGFCERTSIPLYDAAKVGYPKRMRDYDQGRRPRRVDLSELPPWPGDEPEDLAASLDGPPPPPRDVSDDSARVPRTDDVDDPSDTVTPDDQPGDPADVPSETDGSDERPPGDGPTSGEGDEPPDDGPSSPPTSA